MAMWNQKKVKCKKCGKEKESIVQGIVHLSIEHKIHVGYDRKEYLKYLTLVDP